MSTQANAAALAAALAAVGEMAAAACRDVESGVACFAGLAATLAAIRRRAAAGLGLAVEALDDEEAEPAA